MLWVVRALVFAVPSVQNEIYSKNGTPHPK
jgi:hypothetical protein